MAVTAANSGTLTPSITSRTVADGVTNSTATITSATAVFVAGDVGRLVTGSADIPAGAYIQSVTNVTTAVLSVACTGTHVAQTFNLLTEFVLFDSSAAATYTLDVDVNAMAAADVMTLRMYKMVLAGGTRRRFGPPLVLQGAPSTEDVIFVSIPLSTPLADVGAVRFTLEQTKGTARAYPWSANKFA